MRIAPEFKEYDDEIRTLMETVSKNATHASSSKKEDKEGMLFISGLALYFEFTKFDMLCKVFRNFIFHSLAVFP